MIPSAGQASTASDKIFRYYREADQYARRLALHPDSAYGQYVSFVKKHVPSGASFLDLGCGTGQSSTLLGRAGYRVTGVDLSGFCVGEGIRRSERPECSFVQGNILSLPFRGRSFDAAGIFLVIEHIPDVPRLLGEMLRVLKPGGRLVILSPNLLSPFNILVPFVHSWQGKPGRHLFGVKHPVKALSLLIRHAFLLSGKRFSRRVSFTYREPVLENRIDFIADNDAVYLCNPVDFKRFFASSGQADMRSYQREGRIGAFFPSLSTGVYLCAEKRGVCP